jgi:histidinol phosphatase-like enzyme
MIKEITKEWDIDIKNSIMIGDKISDKIAAERSGIYFEYSKNNFYEQIKNFIKKN